MDEITTNKMNNNISIVDKWRKALKEGGYEYRLSVKCQCGKIKKFPRVWRKIFRYLDKNFFENSSSVFEVGCGGGKYLIPFAIAGWQSVGIDVSEEVVKRAKKYTQEISDICKIKLNIELIIKDFFDYNNQKQFDIVFHVGVVEHYLDENERLNFLKKMFTIVKTGGYIISIVPSGAHPLRKRMKEFNLGGYSIPEIDYLPSLMGEEFKKCGAKEIIILPHNVFGYFLFDQGNKFTKIIKKFFYYIFQLIPVSWMSFNFASKHGSALIGIAKK